MSILATVFAAVLAAVYVDNPKTDVKGVHFLTTTLSVSRPKNGSTAFVRGPVRADMSFAAGHVRKPLLRIVCLCEADGELLWMDGLWDKPRTNAKISRSEVSAAFKAAGRDTPCTEARCISSVMPEVGTEPYGSAVYGEPNVNKGFFRLDKVTGNAKLLVCRFEVWQNGALAGVWESSHTGLGKYGIPDDWSVRGRYQKKFRYLKQY